MRKLVVLLMSLLCLAGCSSPRGKTVGGPQKQVLQIRWQRLVDEKGQTCARCGATEKETEAAVRKLRRSLKKLDIEVALEKTAVTAADFSKDPLQSNRIWMAEKPIEEWLQATVGKSQCSGTCGESECRTVTVDGKTYETIPAELIVKAGLLASAGLVGTKPQNPWNPTAEWSQGPSGCCPPSLGGQQK